MNQQQRKHLRERIQWAAHDQFADLYDDDYSNAPPSVKAAVKKRDEAEKVIDAYDRKQYTKRERVRQRIKEQRKAAMEAVLFSEPDKALDAVKKFEAQRDGRRS